MMTRFRKSKNACKKSNPAKYLTIRIDTIVEEKTSNEDEQGFIYDLHDKAREILSEYNDTLKGRCAVCLENFTDEHVCEGETFTDRADLVRIDQCFHRFHLICVYRDWYMPRAKEKDSFGVVMSYELPEVKKCPICRREVGKDEMAYIKEQFKKHPEVDNHAYDA